VRLVDADGAAELPERQNPVLLLGASDLGFDANLKRQAGTATAMPPGVRWRRRAKRGIRLPATKSPPGVTAGRSC